MLRPASISVVCAGRVLIVLFSGERRDLHLGWDFRAIHSSRCYRFGTHRPISGATVGAIRVGHDTKPLTKEHPTGMPPPKKTNRDGRARLVAYFRAAGNAEGFSVFVGDSFVRVDALGYQPKEVRISPIARLDSAPKTKHCEVAIPIMLTAQ